jgi:hypothetical protein
MHEGRALSPLDSADSCGRLLSMLATLFLYARPKARWRAHWMKLAGLICASRRERTRCISQWSFARGPEREALSWAWSTGPPSQANGLSYGSPPAPAGDAGPPSFQPPRKVALDHALKFRGYCSGTFGPASGVTWGHRRLGELAAAPCLLERYRAPAVAAAAHPEAYLFSVARAVPHGSDFSTSTRPLGSTIRTTAGPLPPWADAQ